jgi:ATP-dependent Clp endopeptidase proteolytic subunit ClpP
MDKKLLKKLGVTLLASEDKNHIDLYLVGEFGWEITFQNVISALAGYQNAKTMTIYINSIGGSFVEGLPIFNFLKQHPAKKTTVNMGYAASMGSVLLLVGDVIQAAQNSMVMIHEAATYAFGTKKDLRKEADILEMHESMVIPIYQARLKVSGNEVLEIMEAETWYSAEAAKEAGLIDEVLNPIDVSEFEKALPKNAWQHAVKAYKKMPPELRARAESYADVSKKGLLAKILDAVVGETPPPIIPIIQTLEEESGMTKEELEAALSANNEKLSTAIEEKVTAKLSAEFETKLSAKLDEKLAVLKPLSEDELKDAEIARLKAVLAEKTALSKDDEITKLKADIALLSTPHNPKIIPANTGDAKDLDEDNC